MSYQFNPIDVTSINTQVFFLCMKGNNLVIPDLLNAADFNDYLITLSSHEGKPMFELRTLEYALCPIEYASKNIYLLEVVPDLTGDTLYFQTGHFDGASSFTTDEGILVDAVRVTDIFDFNSIDDLKKLDNHELFYGSGLLSNNKVLMTDWVIKNDIVELYHWLNQSSLDMLLHSLILHGAVNLTIKGFDEDIIDANSFVDQLDSWLDYPLDQQFNPVFLHVASNVDNSLRRRILNFIFHKSMFNTARELIKIGCLIDSQIPAFFTQLTHQNTEGLNSFIDDIVFDKQTIVWWVKAACVTHDAERLDMAEVRINTSFKMAYQSSLIQFAKACCWDEVLTRFTNSELESEIVKSEQGTSDSLTENCTQGNWYACQRLLTQAADVSLNVNEPLRFAVKNGYLGIVKLLHEYGADLEAWGNEPIKLANEHGYMLIKSFLLSEGVEDKYFDEW